MAAKGLRLKAKSTDFTQGGIIKPVLLFALPTLLGNIFSALYNVVDTVVVGQFVGANALAAVGCCFAVSMVCVAVFAGFGMGSGILTAQMFGAKQNDRLTATVNTAYIGGFIVGTSMIIIGEIIAVPLLKLMNTPDAIMEMATQYLRIFLLGCTGQLFYFMGSNMLRGLGDSKWPTYAVVLCSALNIVLDLVFVVVLHWDCAGVALATVIAQTVSGIAVLIRVYTGGYGVKFERKTFKIDPSILKMILAIGVPGALNMMVTSIGTVIIQSFANGFGETLVATNSIAQKIDQFALMPIMAMGSALTMFVGQNMGAGLEKRCNEGMKKITVVILVVGVVLTGACFVLAGPLCRIFVSEEEVIAMGIEAVRLAALFYVFHALQMSLTHMLQGAGATKPVMYLSFIGIAARVVMCYLFAVRTGAWQGLFWATNGYFALMAILAALYIWKGNWKQYVQVRKGPGRPGRPGGPAPSAE